MLDSSVSSDTSGQIETKTGQTYDFETNPSYSVTVTADDSNGGTADQGCDDHPHQPGTKTGRLGLSTDSADCARRQAVTATLD